MDRVDKLKWARHLHSTLHVNNVRVILEEMTIWIYQKLYMFCIVRALSFIVTSRQMFEVYRVDENQKTRDQANL
jgi:hypothetical protein